jgi:Leucine-rich repeat (LRR) protein
VVNFPENRYLPDGSARHTLALSLQLNFLECNDLIGLCVEPLMHDSVCALSQLLYLLDVLYLPEAELRVLVYHDNIKVFIPLFDLLTIIIMDAATLIKCATNGRYKNLVYDKKDPAKSLGQITYLSLDNRNITEIENLDMCTSLSVLYLSENQISTL